MWVQVIAFKRFNDRGSCEWEANKTKPRCNVNPPSKFGSAPVEFCPQPPSSPAQHGGQASFGQRQEASSFEGGARKGSNPFDPGAGANSHAKGSAFADKELAAATTGDLSISRIVDAKGYQKDITDEKPAGLESGYGACR